MWWARALVRCPEVCVSAGWKSFSLADTLVHPAHLCLQRRLLPHVFSSSRETYSQQSAPPLFFPGLEEVLKPIQGASLL